MDLSGTPSKRRSFKWSKEARNLVRANLQVKGEAFRSLLTQLEQLTGNPRDACCRFAHSLGTVKAAYRSWSQKEIDRLVALSQSKSRKEVAAELNRSVKAIEVKQHQLGISLVMEEEQLTKYQLAKILHIRPQAVDEWIQMGLETSNNAGRSSQQRVIITIQKFVEFCRKHPQAVFRRRLSEERFECVFKFVFPPDVSRYLSEVRKAKKQREDYEKYMLKKREMEEALDPDEALDSDSDTESLAAA